MTHSPANQSPDSIDLLAQLKADSSVALVELTRMVTRVLVEHRAYDFREHWDDFVETVLGHLLEQEQSSKAALGRRSKGNHAARSDPKVRMRALETRVRSITLEELVGFFRTITKWDEDGEVPWCENSRLAETPAPEIDIVVAGFRSEIEKLPEQRTQVLGDVYGDGRSFDQVAAHRKLPLRLVKRFLRESIWDLRERCGELLSRDGSAALERSKSCLKSLELDLPAFLVEPYLEVWDEFKAHYPVCQDCSVVVAKWTRVESMVREACNGSRRHPPAEELVSLHRDGQGLAYAQYISLMRHLDGCPACGEAMSLLSHFELRPIGEVLAQRSERKWGSGTHDRVSFISRMVAQVRGWFGR